MFPTKHFDETFSSIKLIKPSYSSSVYYSDLWDIFLVKPISSLISLCSYIKLCSLLEVLLVYQIILELA